MGLDAVDVEGPTGIAACVALQLVAVRMSRGVAFFSILPGGAGLAPAGTFDEAGSGPLQFAPLPPGSLQYDKLTFTVPAPLSIAAPTLLVVDSGNHRVQEVDVVRRAWVGHLFPPGAINGPCGITASAEYIALSALDTSDKKVYWSVQPIRCGDGRGSKRRSKVQHAQAWASHTWVVLFDARTRTMLWRVGGPSGLDLQQFIAPVCVRITRDGLRVVVGDIASQVIVLLSTASGTHVARAALSMRPWEVEEEADGWLVSGGSYATPMSSVRFEGGPEQGSLLVDSTVQLAATSSALVPGWGFVVGGERSNRMQV